MLVLIKASSGDSDVLWWKLERKKCTTQHYAERFSAQ